MATSKTNEFEEYVQGLLECTGCSEPIKLAPIHQCTNGHVVCKNCITKLKNCPICKNNSKLARNLIFEQIVEHYSALELADEGTSEKHKLQKWGQGSVSVFIPNNEPNEDHSVKITLPPNSDTKELAEHGVSRFEEYVKNLLECPICITPIKSAPIHQCTNGHVVCKDCTTKLQNCPICRNWSKLARNIIFEQIIENFSAFEIENEGSSEKPKLQKWGQRILTPKEFVSTGLDNQIRSIQQAAICCCKFILIMLASAILLGFIMYLYILVFRCYNLVLTILAQVGVDIPEKYYSMVGSWNVWGDPWYISGPM
jgi:hypothetical protein